MEVLPEGEVDARGLACPRPVIMAKQAYLDAAPGDRVVILVSKDTQASNVERALRVLGARSIDLAGDDGGGGFFRVQAVREESTGRTTGGGPGSARGVTLVVSSPSLGSPPLGEKLLSSALECFARRDEPPSTVVLLNEAVNLASPDSPALPALAEMEEKGAEILLCGLSVKTHGLEGSIRVGKVVDIDSIVGAVSCPGTVRLA